MKNSLNYKLILRNLLRFSIIVIFVSLFLKLTEEVWRGESVILFDQIISNWIYTLRTPFLTNIMEFITSLADVNTIIVLSILFIIFLFIIKKRRHIVFLIITLLVNLTFVTIIKELLARPRPLLINALVPVSNPYSFPSGHALIAITFYGLLVLYLCSVLKSYSLKVICIIFFTILIILIGFSRIYLGVHWPSDLLASYFVGISWLTFIALTIEYRNNIMGYIRKIINN